MGSAPVSRSNQWITLQKRKDNTRLSYISGVLMQGAIQGSSSDDGNAIKYFKVKLKGLIMRRKRDGQDEIDPSHTLFQRLTSSP